MNVPKLMEAVYEAFNNARPGKKWSPLFVNGIASITYCNEVVSFICKQFGWTKFAVIQTDNPDDAVMANTIVEMMHEYKEWHELAPGDAQNAANEGKLVVAGWKNPAGDHGHVCVLVPGILDYSQTLQTFVPKVMSVGRDIFFGKKASWAFSQVPKYFLLDDSHETVNLA